MTELQEIMQFLDSNRIQILSTSSDNKPISRPIGSAMLFDDKIWYCMNNDKPMFTQLIHNPHICICACASDFSWIRIYAKATFCDNKEVKKIYIQRPKSSFKSIDDPRFSVFFLDMVEAQIHTHKHIKTLTIPRV